MAPGIRQLIGGMLLGLSLAAWADGGAQVRWSGERLSVSADGVPLQELLEHVAAKTGVRLDLVGTFPEPVQVGFQDAPLREALVEILETGGVSYAIVEYFDPQRDAMTLALSVSRKGPATGGASRPPPPPPPAQSAPAPIVASPTPAAGTDDKGEGGSSLPARRLRPSNPSVRPPRATPGAPGAGQPAAPAAPASSFGTVTPYSIKPFEQKPAPANPGTLPR